MSARKTTVLKIFTSENKNLTHLIDILINDKISKQELKKDFEEIYKIWLWDYKGIFLPTIITKYYITKYRKGGIWQKTIVLSKKAQGDILYAVIFEEDNNILKVLDSKTNIIFEKELPDFNYE